MVGCWMFAAASMPPEGVRAAGAACFGRAPRFGLRDAAATGGWGRAKRAPSGVRARMRRLCCGSCVLSAIAVIRAA